MLLITTTTTKSIVLFVYSYQVHPYCTLVPGCVPYCTRTMIGQHLQVALLVSTRVPGVLCVDVVPIASGSLPVSLNSPVVPTRYQCTVTSVSKKEETHRDGWAGRSGRERGDTHTERRPGPSKSQNNATAQPPTLPYLALVRVTGTRYSTGTQGTVQGTMYTSR